MTPSQLQALQKCLAEALASAYAKGLVNGYQVAQAGKSTEELAELSSLFKAGANEVLASCSVTLH